MAYICTQVDLPVWAAEWLELNDPGKSTQEQRNQLNAWINEHFPDGYAILYNGLCVQDICDPQGPCSYMSESPLFGDEPCECYDCIFYSK